MANFITDYMVNIEAKSAAYYAFTVGIAMAPPAGDAVYRVPN